MSTTSYEPITSIKDIENPRPYTAKAQAFDCLVFLLFLSILVVAVGVVPGVTRLLIFLQPHQPNFNIDSFSLAVVNVTPNVVTTNWHVTLSARNPNGNSMFFDEIKVSSVLNRNERVSNITIAPIELSPKGIESMEAVFPNMLIQVNNCSPMNLSCGSVNLTMDLVATAKYGGWTWPIKEDVMKIVCEDVKVRLPSKPSTMAFGSSNCDVDGQWKRFVTKCDHIFWHYLFVVVIVLVILAVSL